MRRGLRAAFTLVELMAAVSILSVGIVLIARSFISVAQALDSMRNRISAIQFLETKMSEWEQAAREAQGLKADEKQEEAEVGVRQAAYRAEISLLEDDEAEDIVQARVSLSWTEENRAKELALATYFNEKK